MAKNSPKDTLTVLSTKQNGLRRWEPVSSGEMQALLSSLQFPDDTARQELKEKTVGILSKCLPPSLTKQSETGLVIGYVQSGKTRSFIALSALARDNSYQLIIVITGISKLLFRQSALRMRRDLKIDKPEWSSWQFLENPTRSKAANINSRLRSWKDKKDPLKPCVLITVMKHHKHIQNLTDFLRELDLDHISALIIDDEADQASLNNLANEGQRSKTYEKLLELRSALPTHSYVQYTATPQAPLLINIIDNLSPRFVDLLDPGPDYVGGKEFFINSPNLIIEIPDAELPENDLHEPPESFLSALRYFFLGAASVLAEGKHQNRSMLVHPSRDKQTHMQYHRWIRAIKDAWLSHLSSDSHDRTDLLQQFKAEYKELKKTVPTLLPFERLSPMLIYAINHTHLEEVNTRETSTTPIVEFSQAPFHILVGGQAMDRGYTVEGLAVTYMPRGRGTGNADTIQQRARFFGYKRSYLGFCRVFLETGVRHAFAEYVDHEEDIRNRLKDHNANGESLTKWKRAFFLSTDLRATRPSVISLPYQVGTFSENWFRQAYPFYANGLNVADNAALVDDYLSSLTFLTEDSESFPGIHWHDVAEVPLQELFERFLIPFKIGHPRDSKAFTGLLLQIKHFLSTQPDAKAFIYRMAKGRRRERPVREDGKLATNLFQGPTQGKRGDRPYPSDGACLVESAVTLQLHTLKVTDAKGNVLGSPVPVLAVWAPRSLRKDWFVMEDGGID